MRVELRPASFAPLAELANYQAEVDTRLLGQYGALSMFIGTMRDFNDGVAVQAMNLEHYPGMTEYQLQRIAEAAWRQWPVLDGLLLHRVGALQPGEPIVLVAVWTAQRAAAFSACRFLIEELKAKAPFWKREETGQGAHWVSHNTPA